jgi:hypothetical protein
MKFIQHKSRKPIAQKHMNDVHSTNEVCSLQTYSVQIIRFSDCIALSVSAVDPYRVYMGNVIGLILRSNRGLAEHVNRGGYPV